MSSDGGAGDSDLILQNMGLVGTSRFGSGRKSIREGKANKREKYYYYKKCTATQRIDNNKIMPMRLAASLFFNSAMGAVNCLV